METAPLLLSAAGHAAIVSRGRIRESGRGLPRKNSSAVVGTWPGRRAGQRRTDRLAPHATRLAGGDGGGEDERDDAAASFRRQFLLQYVEDVQPQLLDQFLTRAPSEVVDAMRQTVSNMLGTLPPQFFQVTVTTVGENLAQLLFSVMMTGYLFRNAQNRLELRRSLGALPAGAGAAASAADAAGGPGAGGLGAGFAAVSQTDKVQGQVLRWSDEAGVQAVGARDYITSLESEVLCLREKLEALQRASAGRNELLEDLKALEPSNMAELTARAGDDTVDAMNAFIARVMGGSSAEELRASSSTTSNTELARLLYWLMVVGYSLRTIEVKFEMERVLGSGQGGDDYLTRLTLPPGTPP